MGVGDPFGLRGQVLDGQFRVDEPIGEGGFSVVYKGHHVGLDEPIAVKCLKLPPSLGSAVVESFVRRFRDESRLHYRLSQGNLYIARSIASGTTMSPSTGALVPYMVLEWLEGRSLAADFGDRRMRGMRGRTLEEAVRLLDPAVDALAYAHAKGVVHRDMNPGNLFLTLTRDGTKLKVLDFGVAKIVSDHALDMGPRAQTLGYIRIFSPAYAAPEQFEDKIGRVGPWTDVYALTLVLLEALRDRTVNEGEHLGEFAMKTLDESFRPTPRALGIAVGDEVEALLARAVALHPMERPQDAGELWGALKNAMKKDAASGKAPHARKPSLAPRTSVPPGDNPNVTSVMAATSAPAIEAARSPSAPPRKNAATVRMSSAPALPVAEPAPPTTLRTNELQGPQHATTQAFLSHTPPPVVPIATPAPAPAYAPYGPAPAPNLTQSGGFPPPRTPTNGGAPLPPVPPTALQASASLSPGPPLGAQGIWARAGVPPLQAPDDTIPRSRASLYVVLLLVVVVVVTALLAIYAR